MPSFSTIRRVPFTSRQMFDLVADVERYPEFLPLCEALTVKKRGSDGDKSILICEMAVGYQALRESFTSRVVLDPSAPQVLAGSVPEYPSGPFRQPSSLRWMENFPFGVTAFLVQPSEVKGCPLPLDTGRI